MSSDNWQPRGILKEEYIKMEMSFQYIKVYSQ